MQRQPGSDALASGSLRVITDVSRLASAAGLGASVIRRLDASHAYLVAVAAPQCAVAIVHLHDLAHERRWQISGHSGTPGASRTRSTDSRVIVASGTLSPISPDYESVDVPAMFHGMGLPRVRSLHDLHRHDADLKVTCLRCRHVAIFDAARIIAYFHSRGWNMAWELVAAHFRCGRCGVKRVDVGLAPKAKKLPIPVPEPLAAPSPRDVKEHIRRTRG